MRSLKYFLEEAIDSEMDLTEVDQKDVIALVDWLRHKDDYFGENGERLISSIRTNEKSEIRQFLQDWPWSGENLSDSSRA